MMMKRLEDALCKLPDPRKGKIHEKVSNRGKKGVGRGLEGQR